MAITRLAKAGSMPREKKYSPARVPPVERPARCPVSPADIVEDKMRIEMDRLENAARMAMAHQPASVDIAPQAGPWRFVSMAMGIAAVLAMALYALLA